MFDSISVTLKQIEDIRKKCVKSLEKLLDKEKYENKINVGKFICNMEEFRELKQYEIR